MKITSAFSGYNVIDVANDTVYVIPKSVPTLVGN